MRFNKYLAMCFLASSLMCGSFTSCGDDDDDDNDGSSVVDEGKTTIEKGRADGKKFGELYQQGMAAYEANEYVKALALMPEAVSLSNSYNNSTDNVYKGAFAEGAAEVISGHGETGDAAMEKMNGWLKNLSLIQNFLGGGGNGGNTSEGNGEVTE